MSEDASHGIFSSLEIDTIGEIMNISMGSAATAASTLLDNKVNITTPVVKVVLLEDFRISHLEPAIAVEIEYVEGISGSNILILKRADVRAILSQMLMTELPEDFAIDEMAESAICELMNQMMGSSATVLSCFLGRSINISTPQTVPVDAVETLRDKYFGGDDSIVSIEFTLTIKDTIESIFVCAMKIGLAKEIIDVSLNFDAGEGLEDMDADEGGESAAIPAPPIPPAPEPPMPPPPPPAAQPAVTVAPPQAPPAAPPPAAGPVPPAAAYPPPPAYPPYGYPPYPPQAPYPPSPPAYAGYEQQAPVTVREYNYGDFAQPGGAGKDRTNLDLVMNVPVTMTVELGRTKRKIKDILEFGQGTIVELDKQAGSQVDVIVNGQLIARGDVVVVDDNFSIRITEILKNRDSLGMI